MTINDYAPKTTGPLIGDCVEAKVETGILLTGQQLLLMPLNQVVGVKGLICRDEQAQHAFAGSIVDIGLRLPNDFDTNFLKRGNVLCDPNQNPIKVVKKFRANVHILDSPYNFFIQGEQVMVHSYSTKGPGKIEKLVALIDPKTGEVTKNRPKKLSKEMFATI